MTNLSVPLSLFIYLFICRFISHLHKKHSGIKYVWRISVKHLWLSLYMQCFIPRGCSRFQVMGMVKLGQKPKPQKILRPSNKTPTNVCVKNQLQKNPMLTFPNLKNFQKALNDMALKIETLEIECLCLCIHHTIWSYHESSYCFEDPKNPYLNQATQKILAKFSYPKISRNWNFKPQKSFYHPRHLRIRSTPSRALSMSDIVSAWDFVQYNHCKIVSPSKISLKHDTMNWSIWTEWRWTAGTMV